MRAKAFTAIFAATLAVIAVALPASSPAATHFYRQRAVVDAEINLRGTNGFRFLAFTFGRTDVVSALKPTSRIGRQSVDYIARTKRGDPSFKDGVLTLSIGRLGRFHGRFVATATETRKPSHGCTGEPTTTEKGYFVGSFNFHGERGYSTIHADREHGAVTHQGATRCPSWVEHPGREAKQAEENADAGEARLIAGDRKNRVLFQAHGESLATGSALTYFQASVAAGRAGPFQVTHSAYVLDFNSGAAATFQTPDPVGPPAEATITPPAPFSGAATFQLERPTTASWTGDLAVELPGLGTVPLTGPKIAAGLCHGRSDCTKTLPPVPQLLLETTGGAGDSSGYATVSVRTKRGS